MAITHLELAESIEFVARELEALRPDDPRLFSSDGKMVPSEIDESRAAYLREHYADGAEAALTALRAGSTTDLPAAEIAMARLSTDERAAWARGWSAVIDHRDAPAAAFVGARDNKGKPAASAGYLRMLAQAARETQRGIEERARAARPGADIAFPPVPGSGAGAASTGECADCTRTTICDRCAGP